MSVSHDSLVGDTIYVIEGFIAKFVLDQDGNFDSTKSIELAVGDKVEYMDWFIKNSTDNPYRMITYKHPLTGDTLAALESYFVTKSVWEELKNYFHKNTSSGEGYENKN
ncbi:hypothetical protein NYE40_08300 [Paenibacillus sp. FSL W8-1187]|uniref:hypothetical protein n=1 Tax=Paenibacillus sp. FSL W8-1187 TaxID=2975339 RepID=UPI0030D6EBC9